MTGTEPTTAVKERPIIFSGSMITAILEGRKTQTRRIFAPEKITVDTYPKGFYYRTHATRGGETYVTGQGPFLPNDWLHYCPYGQAGDHIWVKESFAPRTDVDPLKQPNKARHYCLYKANGGKGPKDELNWHDYGTRWRSPMFMPRWASRIILEITDVRVQRLQDISEEHAKAEGIRTMRDGIGCFVGREGPGKLVTPWPTAKEAFADIWDSLNEKRGYPWSANHWVWALSFRRVNA